MSFKLTYTGQQVQSYLDKVATGQAGGGTKDYNTLEHVPIINQDLSVEGFSPIVNTYYKHTGITGEVFTQGVIYLYSGDAYKALDGEVPTKVSQLQNDSGYTTNKGTVTSVSVKMNGVTKGPITSSGIIDLGTVLTSHQDISDKANLSGGNTFDAQQIFSDTIGTTEISGSVVEIKASSQGSSLFRLLNIHTAEVIRITGEESGLIEIEAPIMLGGSKGAAGQVLTSQGANDAPQWVTPAIQSASLSGTTLTLTL